VYNLFARYSNAQVKANFTVKFSELRFCWMNKHHGLDVLDLREFDKAYLLNGAVKRRMF
jgi:phosphoserine aminotransferase